MPAQGRAADYLQIFGTSRAERSHYSFDRAANRLACAAKSILNCLLPKTSLVQHPALLRSLGTERH